jgi:hypothetical protein
MSKELISHVMKKRFGEQPEEFYTHGFEKPVKC